MSNYTKGPWTCCETTLSGECIGFHITASECGSIAPLAEFSGAFGVTSDEARANGRLMAAAPALFECLKSILNDLPSKRDWLDPVVEAMARATIKKATEGTK